MENILVLLIILSACLLVLWKASMKKKQSKCSSCSTSNCSACPLVTNSALHTHLKTRKEVNQSS